MKPSFMIDLVKPSSTVKARIYNDKEIRKSHKVESTSSASFVKPRITSIVSNSFVGSSWAGSKPDYATSSLLKHQRRVSDTQFSKKPLVKYEPLTK